MRDAKQSRLVIGGVQKPSPPVIALIGKWLTDNPVRRADLPQNIAALDIDHQEPTVRVPSKVTPPSVPEHRPRLQPLGPANNRPGRPGLGRATARRAAGRVIFSARKRRWRAPVARPGNRSCTSRCQRTKPRYLGRILAGPQRALGQEC
jgi:hypothetical protein